MEGLRKTQTPGSKPRAQGEKTGAARKLQEQCVLSPMTLWLQYPWLLHAFGSRSIWAAARCLALWTGASEATAVRAGVVDSQVLPDRWCIGRAPEAMTRMCLAISSHTRAFDLRHQPPKHQEHSSQSPLSRNGQEQKHVLFLLAADTSSARVHITSSESKGIMSSYR